jgi:hypothetical protein
MELQRLERPLVTATIATKTPILDEIYSRPSELSPAAREALRTAQQLKARAPRSDAARVAKETRAKTVARILTELNDLKPQMFEDQSEYSRLRAMYPDFLTFKIAEQRHDLKTKVLAIQSSTRHVRLAQELAGAHHGRELSTIQDDWKDFKPIEFKRPK